MPRIEHVVSQMVQARIVRAEKPSGYIAELPFASWRFAQANERKHPARLWAFFPVTKEKIRAATCAQATREKVGLNKTGGEELRSVGFAEIQMYLLWRRLVPGRTHVQPLQGIRFVAGEGLVKIFRRIGKLSGKLAYEISADLVAAGTDGRADGRKNVRGLAAKFEMQPT